MATSQAAVKLIPGQKPLISPQANSLDGNYKLYNSGVQQNAEDYDSIMQGYRDQIGRNNMQSESSLFKGYTPQIYNYSESPDETSSIRNLGDLSKTGGYSPQDIANLRERGISPIRAIYANAQRNLVRQKNLQGGYSPNFAAASTKMAREQSDLISGATTKVNADIAQNVASNKIQVAPQYNQAATHASDTANQFGARNTDILNDASKFNSTMPLEIAKFKIGGNLDALRGMTSLYGTTPALASTFGNQALNAAGQQSQNINTKNQQGIQTIAQLMSGAR